jgi:hypothetical protein
LTRLLRNFGEEIEGKRKFLTPGTPRFKIQRPTINMDVLDPQSQRKYRSGVGMLLYLTKYSRPNISNIYQELSKSMDSAKWGAYNELLRVIKFVIDTKTFGLRVQPKLDNNLGWDLKIFCDSNWAGNPKKRVSVMGFIIYLLNIPICWRSKSQKGVTLLSTEAKYVAISEAVKEHKFIHYLLSDLHIKVNLPIVVKTDNIGAIFMSENASTRFHTRHVHTCYYFVREFIEDLSKSSSSVQLKMILIYLRRTLIRSYMRNTRRNFWKIVEFTVPVDRYRIGRVLEISFAINNLVLHV